MTKIIDIKQNTKFTTTYNYSTYFMCSVIYTSVYKKIM